MKHNKWMVTCLGCLVASAIPGGLEMMFCFLCCLVFAGLCFSKWIVEEDKYQRAEHQKYLEKLKKKEINK